MSPTTHNILWSLRYVLFLSLLATARAVYPARTPCACMCVNTHTHTPSKFLSAHDSAHRSSLQCLLSSMTARHRTLAPGIPHSQHTAISHHVFRLPPPLGCDLLGDNGLACLILLTTPPDTQEMLIESGQVNKLSVFSLNHAAFPNINPWKKT